MQPEVDETNSVPGIARQGPGVTRDEDLPAVAGRYDARDAVEVDAHVVVAMPPRLSGVQAHPDPDGGGRFGEHE